MKILSITPFLQGSQFNPFFEGKEDISNRLTHSLVKEGHEVYVLPWVDEEIWNKTDFVVADDSSHATAIPTLYIPRLTNLAKDLFLSFSSKKAFSNPRQHIWQVIQDSFYNKNIFLQKAIKSVKPDLVHVHYTPSDAVKLYRKLGYPAPIVLTHYSKTLTDNAALYDYTVFVSKSQQEEACESYPELKEKSVYINYSVDNEYRRHTDPKKSENIICLEKAPSQNKFPASLEACRMDSKLTDYNLTIIGEGLCEKKYINFLEKHNLGNIRLLELLSHKQNADLMSEATLFVAPNPSNYFELTYLQALSMGLPIIGCPQTIQELNRVLEMNTGFELDSKTATPQKIADLIVTAMNSELTDVVYRKKLMERVRNTFTYENFKEKYLRLYHDITNSQQPPNLSINENIENYSVFERSSG